MGWWWVDADAGWISNHALSGTCAHGFSASGGEPFTHTPWGASLVRGCQLAQDPGCCRSPRSPDYLSSWNFARSIASWLRRQPDRWVPGSVVASESIGACGLYIGCKRNRGAQSEQLAQASRHCESNPIRCNTACSRAGGRCPVSRLYDSQNLRWQAGRQTHISASDTGRLGRDAWEGGGSHVVLSGSHPLNFPFGKRRCAGCRVTPTSCCGQTPQTRAQGGTTNGLREKT